MTRPSSSDAEQRACREAFDKAGYWPNEVMWKAWQQAWEAALRSTLQRNDMTEELEREIKLMVAEILRQMARNASASGRDFIYVCDVESVVGSLE